MSITIDVMESCTDLPDCMTEEEFRSGTIDDEYLSMLSECVLHGWP